MGGVSNNYGPSPDDKGQEGQGPGYKIKLEPTWGIDSFRFKLVPTPDETGMSDYNLDLPADFGEWRTDAKPPEFGEIDPEGQPSTDLPPAPAGDGFLELGLADPLI